MRAALRPRYTFAEYVDLERRSRDVKHEYVGGEIDAMAGGTVEHSALTTAVVGLLFAHLRGGALQASRLVLVAQDRRRVDVWRRTDDGWSLATYEAGASATLPSTGFDLSVDDLYGAAGVA